MRAQMSATAWKTGAQNAGVVAIGTSVIWLLLTAATIIITRMPFWQSARIGFSLLWTGTFALLAFTFFRAWSMKGQVIIDCGPRPMRWLFILNACLFFFIGLTGGFSLLADPFGFQIGFSLSVAFFYLLMVFGRLQICTQGIWQYLGLLEWQQIQSYHWRGSTLILEARSKIPFMGRGALPFPAECVTTVDAILRDHCIKPSSPNIQNE